jgi:hypothetical protein
MKSPQTLLTVRQVALDGAETVSRVHHLGPDAFARQSAGEAPVALAASEPIAAIEEAHILHINGQAETFIQRDQPDVLPLDRLLDALQVEGEPLDVEEWGDDGSPIFGDLEETSLRWSTSHRVSIHGSPVYGVQTEGRVEWVPADDTDTPHDSWTELLALNWNNLGNTAVGMASYGVDGLFLVRPGLLATVASTDEEYQVTLERIAADGDVTALVLKRLNRVGHPSVLLAALQPETAEDDDEEPDSWLTSSLDPGIFSRIWNDLHSRGANRH